MATTKYYVIATDRLMSGWGLATGKIAKRVIACENRQQAEALRDRMDRPVTHMKYVNVTCGDRPPYYPSSRYVVTYDTYTDNLFSY